MARFDYIAPARVRVRVVPVGGIPPAVFARHLSSIRTLADVRLVDLSPLPSCRHFNPQALAQGRIFYEYTDADDAAFLGDFEPFRKTFVVLGVAVENAAGTGADAHNAAHVAALRERFPAAIVHNVVCFQAAAARGTADVFAVSPHAETIITSVETVLCGVSENFLRALDAYAASYENITLRSPVAFTNSTVLARTITQAQKRASTASSLKVSFASPEPKGKFSPRQSGRQAKLMGNFFLLAGRCTTAMQYFADAAINLKKADDHLWLASALDGLAVASLVASYLDLPHAVSNPMLASVLHVPKAKPAPKASSESASRRPSTSSPRTSLSSTASAGVRLSAASPDLASLPIVDLLLLLYSRFAYYYHASASDDENCVPDVVYVESLLRNINLMVSVYLCGGAPAKKILASVVTGAPERSAGADPHISRSEIMREIDKIFELQLVQLEFSEQCRIYRALSSVYAALGYHRKQGFILRVLLIALTPKVSLIEESGSLDGICSRDSIRDIFELLFSIYGIDTPTEASQKEAHDHYADWISIQLSLLKICLRIAEALRDYLTLAKLCVLTFSRFAHCLAAEDQLKVKEKLAWLKLLLAAENKDFRIPHPDPFLVRNASFVASPTSNLHLYVPPVSAGKEMAFFDPFKKRTPQNTNMDNVVCVHETYQLRLVLQNPYLFDLELHDVQIVEDSGKKLEVVHSSLSLVSSTPFSTNQEASNAFKNTRLRKTPLPPPGEQSSELVLPPHSLNEVILSFRPLETGNLSISGFQIAVENTDSQLFYIVSQEKATELQKLKSGPATKKSSLDELMKNLSCNEIGDRIVKKVVPLKAVQQQPKLSVMKNSVSNGWMMLLEGESQRHSLELRNMSSEIVNYVSFSLWDSTIDATNAILNSSNLAEEEIFELEWQLIKKKALTIVNKAEIASKYRVIEPGCEIKIDYDVFGKRGMTDSKMILEYGHKGFGDGEHFVKNLVVPLNYTVNRSLEIVGAEILPFFSSFLQGFSGPAQDVQAADRNMHDLLEFFANIKSSSSEDVSDYCLLLLDVKNMWRDELSAKISNHIKPEFTYIVEDVIKPNTTKRLLIPVKRTQQDSSEVVKPIPSLRNKQFVKNYNQTDAEVFQSRLSYWTRCSLLSKMSGEWCTRGVSNKRSGEIDLRKMCLTPAMTNALNYDRISIQHEIFSEDGPVAKKSNKHVLVREKFYVMKTRITNHTKEAISGTLRHVPQPLHAVTKQDLDLGSKILYNGVLQMHLGENAIVAGGTLELETAFLVLQKGQYEWGCMFDIARDRTQRIVGREPVYMTAE